MTYSHRIKDSCKESMQDVKTRNRGSVVGGKGLTTLDAPIKTQKVRSHTKLNPFGL